MEYEILLDRTEKLVMRINQLSTSNPNKKHTPLFEGDLEYHFI